MMLFMDTTSNEYATATNAVEGRWNALAPALPTVAPEDYAEFFATVPADTVIEYYSDLYRRLTNGSWQSLDDIDQGYGSDDDAELVSFHHADLACRINEGLSRDPQPVRVLLLGKRPLWV